MSDKDADALFPLPNSSSVLQIKITRVRGSGIPRPRNGTSLPPSANLVRFRKWGNPKVRSQSDRTPLYSRGLPNRNAERMIVGIRTATREEASRYEISRALGNGNENGVTATRYHLQLGVGEEEERKLTGR